MSAALVLLVVFWTLAFFGSHMVTGFREAFTYCIDNMYTLEISTNSLRTLFLHFVLLFFEILAPILIMAIIIGVAANVMQVGFLFTWKPVKPELSRISFTPQKIFQRVLFSKQAMVNLVKSVLKIVVIGIVAWLIIEGELPKMINLMDVGVAGAMDSITNVVFVMVNATCLALLALSVPDYIFQRRQHLESLKMSIPEIKEEHKMEEGDPLIKSRIMQKSRELAQRNLPAMVKKADVVITNPTHLSVALQFDMNIHDQPVVVAKGPTTWPLSSGRSRPRPGFPSWKTNRWPGRSITMSISGTRSPRASSVPLSRSINGSRNSETGIIRGCAHDPSGIPSRRLR